MRKKGKERTENERKGALRRHTDKNRERSRRERENKEV